MPGHRPPQPLSAAHLHIYAEEILRGFHFEEAPFPKFGSFSSVLPGGSYDCMSALSGWATARCQTILPSGHLNDTARLRAVVHDDSSMWENLVAIPTGSPATVANRTKAPGAAVPLPQEIERGREMLWLLRDAIVLPPLEVDESVRVKSGTTERRGSKWGGWENMPPCLVFSAPHCPIAEVSL